MDETYLWIARWEHFQHYQPERDRAPAWIKDYMKQRDDDGWRDLSLSMRGLLTELRAEFARAQSKLRADPKRLSSRLGATVYQHQLESLNDAGYIEFVSRATLDTRLDLLYASRAPARTRRSKKLEVEVEKEKTKAVTSTRDAARNGNGLTAQEHLTQVKEIIAESPIKGGDAA